MFVFAVGTLMTVIGLFQLSLANFINILNKKY
jgi:hypothetical protein